MTWSQSVTETISNELVQYSLDLGIDAEMFRQALQSNIEDREKDAREACEKAIAILTKMGFSLVHTSSLSEARYYALPDHNGAIRVATHRGGGRHFRHQNGEQPTLGKITFNRGQGKITDCHIEEKVVSAVGRYFMARLLGNNNDKTGDLT